jgi:hypothetical protein
VIISLYSIGGFMGYIDKEAVEAALRGCGAAGLKRYFPDGKVVSGEFTCRNIARGDNKQGSFSINLRSGKWSDFATDDRGLGYLGFISCGMGWGFKDGLTALAADMGIIAEAGVKIKRPVAKAADFLDTPDNPKEAGTYQKAMDIWKGAGDVDGTEAHDYLKARKLPLQGVDCIRYAKIFNKEYGQEIGALIMPVRGESGLQAIQRIWINPNGAADYKDVLGCRKMGLGQIKGGAFKLGRNKQCIVLTEGAEDALALWGYAPMMEANWIGMGYGDLPSVWAVLGRSGFFNQSLPKGADIYFYLDRDNLDVNYQKFVVKINDLLIKRNEAGEGWGKILFPPKPYKDYNDYVIKNSPW